MPPQWMQVVTDGYGYMKIPAVKGLSFSTFQPELGLSGTAQRAASMFAGVVH